MKNKRINLFLLFILLLAGFFIFSKDTQALENLVISEVAVGIKSANNEFIELYNPTSSEIDLTGLKLKLANSSGKSTNKTITWINTTIKPYKFFLFGTGIIGTIFDATYTSGSITGTGGAAIEKDGTILDQVIWSGLKTDESWERNANNFEPNNNTAFSLQKNPTPQNSLWGKEPEPEPETDPETKPLTSSTKVILNEILPNASEEYIELYNSGETDEDLSAWILRDASKNGKYVFPQNSEIKASSFLVIYKKTFKFALNNSGTETVTLFDNLEKEMSKLSYSGSAKKNVSYNFDGANWRWSKFLTPGKENIFNNLPVISTKKNNKIYVGVYAEFSAKGNDADKDELKYTWDFGDGHKSYKATTRHKYKKPGKYEVTLKVSDGSEDKIETFKVEVKKFPHPKMSITSIMTNPEGNDSENEYIVIKNNSKKKINLSGWSIATGSKKLYNHPIYNDLEIKPGKELKITREHSKFTLNNKQSKIELRYPDGKVASKMKYEKKKSTIAEGELYTKTKKKWQWIATKNPVPPTISTLPPENDLATSVNISVSSMLKISAKEVQENLGKISENTKKKENALLLTAMPELPAPKNISFSHQEKINFLLGIPTVRAEGESYHFTNPNYQPPDHYAIKFLKTLGQKINFHINSFLSSY